MWGSPQGLIFFYSSPFLYMHVQIYYTYRLYSLVSLFVILLQQIKITGYKKEFQHSDNGSQNVSLAHHDDDIICLC